MSIGTVDVSIHRLRREMEEMDDVVPASWLPEHTWRLFVRPMLLALGWDPDGPEACRCPSLTGCSFFAGSVRDSREQPDLVVHVAPLGAALARAASWAESCAGAGPRPVKGASVLTNGAEWWIYDLSKSGTGGRLVYRINVTEGSRMRAARLVHEWAGRSVFT